MQAYDEACLRLARAMQRPPGELEAALQDVGVDAAYLSRCLLDGDPQGVIGSLSDRLGVPRRQLVLAIVSAGGLGAPRRAAQAPARPRAAVFARASVALFVVGVALVAFASLAFWRVDAFRAALTYGAAGLLVLVAFAALVASWRLGRAALALRRRRGG